MEYPVSIGSEGGVKGGEGELLSLLLRSLLLRPLLRLLEYPANLRLTSNRDVVPPELLSFTCCHPPLVEFVTALEKAVGVLYSMVPTKQMRKCKQRNV